jgi:hypothetical protein
MIHRWCGSRRPIPALAETGPGREASLREIREFTGTGRSGGGYLPGLVLAHTIFSQAPLGR